MLVNTSALNKLFGCAGPEWIELDEVASVSVSPVNDIGGEDCFWSVASKDQIEVRNAKIRNTYAEMTEKQWAELVEHRQKNSKQRQEIELDGKVFKSKNACARYCMEEYGVSRNTALRYLAEGRHPKDAKQSGREYKGSYRNAKYM